jgi:hypothetical protein
LGSYFADVVIVVLGVEVGGDHLHVVAAHDARELRPHTLCTVASTRALSVKHQGSLSLPPQLSTLSTVVLQGKPLKGGIPRCMHKISWVYTRLCVHLGSDCVPMNIGPVMCRRVTCALNGARVNEVVVAPLGVVVVLLVGVVHVQKGQVVAVDVGETRLCLIRRLNIRGTFKEHSQIVSLKQPFPSTSWDKLPVAPRRLPSVGGGEPKS